MWLFLPIRYLASSRKNNSLKNFDYVPTYDNKGNEILDYIEVEAKRGNRMAIDLLAIEDASEIAKSYMFDEKKRVFENIMSDITNVPTHCDTFTSKNLTRSTKRCFKVNKPQEVIHVGYEFNEGGHYSSAIKSGKNVVFFDSMCNSEYGPKFRKYINQRYKEKLNIKEAFSNRKFQPSGGFAPDRNSLRHFLRSARVNVKNENFEKMYNISQYDLLSQHHFCYIEALVYLFHKILRTPIGPHMDPEQRLRFIKSVMWCLIFKYANPNTNTGAFKYFENNFKYYLKLDNVVYNQKGFYMPTNRPLKYRLRTINFMNPRYIKQASIRKIIKYSLAQAGVSVRPTRPQSILARKLNAARLPK